MVIQTSKLRNILEIQKKNSFHSLTTKVSDSLPLIHAYDQYELTKFTIFQTKMRNTLFNSTHFAYPVNCNVDRIMYVEFESVLPCFIVGC